MKYIILILLILAGVGGYFYYEKISKPNESEIKAEIAVLEAQIGAEEDTSASAADTLKRRVKLEAKTLFPDGSEAILERWVNAQLDFKQKIDAMQKPESISAEDFKKLKARAEQAKPYQYQSQHAILRDELSAIADMERISTASGVDTQDFRLKRKEVEKRFPESYKSQKTYMAAYVEAMFKMNSFRATLGDSEFERLKNESFQAHQNSPMEAMAAFVEQAAAKSKIDSEFSSDMYRARVELVRQEFPNDYAKQYNTLKSGTSVSASKGALSLHDLKNAAGQPISTDSIFVMRSLSGGAPAVLTAVGGRKVFLADFFRFQEGQTLMLDNGKENVKCSRVVYSREYPVICLMPDAEPQTQTAAFLTQDVQKINGLPAMAVGPNAMGVLNIDAVIPTVSAQALITLDIPLRTFPNGCALIDKNSGLFISISVKYPRAPWLPAKGKVRENDLITRTDKVPSSFTVLVSGIREAERKFRERQGAGITVFAKPSELASWGPWDQKKYEIQSALVEKLYIENCDFLEYFCERKFNYARDTKSLRWLYDKHARAFNPISGFQKNSKTALEPYIKDLETLMQKDIANLSIKDLNPLLHAEAEHQVSLRKMMLDYVAELKNSQKRMALAPEPD